MASAGSSPDRRVSGAKARPLRESDDTQAEESTAGPSVTCAALTAQDRAGEDTKW